MRWTYCDRWNDLMEEPIDPLKESEARRRHETGDLYTVVGEEDSKTKLLVEVRLENGYVGVKFLDNLGRNELIFNFKNFDNRLFLRKVISYDYGESQERGGYADPVVIETFTYKPDGTMRREINKTRQKQIEVADYRSIDVHIHWEPVPSFGNYESIARRDRD